MSIAASPGSADFVVGGPVQPDHARYVWRDADRELQHHLRLREYCHVLAPPQVGKTSLMAQAARQLRAQGRTVAALDLAEIGSRGFADDAGRWYYSFAYRVVRELRIRTELSTWWQERSGLTTMQRLRDFFLEVVLAGTHDAVVIFLDRIEVLAEHPRAAEIFDAIRACFDARATEPDYQRLCFVLLGTPASRRLLTERPDSVFAISEAVTLGDFTPGEIKELLRDLPVPAEVITGVADRVWHWTGGHPYLSHKLCRALARCPPVEIATAGAVDDCARRLYFGRNALREDAHLSLLVARLLARTPGCAARLTLLGRVGKGASVAVDAGHRVQRELLDLGVLVDRDGTLGVRNRIYAGVFSPSWVNRHLPVSWKDIAIAAAATLLIVAVPVWYTQYLPRPYVSALQAERQDFVSARDAWSRLRRIPGFGSQADGLFAEYLTRQGHNATRLSEVRRIGERLARLPGGTERAAVLLAGFWDRRANAMAQIGDRDGAIMYTLKGLEQPTRERQQRLDELLGAGFPGLLATIRPGAPLRALEVDPEAALLTTLDERHEIVVWRLGQREPRPEQRLALTAEEVRPLQRSRVHRAAGVARQLELVVRTDHPRPRDLEIILQAPSGRQAVLPVAVARQGAQAGEFRFDSRRIDGLRTLLNQGAAGTWTALVADIRKGVSGRLLGWSLVIDGRAADAASGQAGGDDGTIPQPQIAVELASALGPGGRRALTWPLDADARGSIMVWDLARGEVIARLPRPGGLVSARFVLGHSAVLTVGERELELREATGGRLIGRLATESRSRPELLLSDNGRYLVLDEDIGADASALTLWDINGLRRLGQIITGARAEVVAVDPGGRFIAVGDRDRFVRVWQARDQALVAECEHPAAPVAIGFDPAGHWLVTQDRVDTLRIWDPIAGCRTVVSRHGNGPWQVTFSPDGDSMMAGNYSRGFEVLSLPAGQRLAAAFQPGMSRAGSAPGNAASRPRILPSMGLAMTYDGRRAVKLWNLPRRAGETSGAMPGGVVEFAASDSNGQIAFGNAGGDVRVQLWAGSATLRLAADTGPGFIGHLAAVTSLVFDPTGRLVASGALDGTVRVWDAQSGVPRRFFVAHGDGAVLDVEFLPGGAELVSASRGSALVIDANSGEVRARLGIQAEPPDLAVSRDGEWIYVGGDRGGITRWNWRSGSVGAMTGGEHRVRAIALSDDGQLLASAGADRVVRLWRPQAGASLRRTFVAPAPVNALWFAAEGRLHVQSGAWLHTLDVDSAGLSASRSRALPDPSTQAGPTAGGDGLLLLTGAPNALPLVQRLGEAGSWASRTDGVAESAAAIATRLALTVNELGEVRPVGDGDND
jgi:WD40 repeat protein